MFSHKKHEKTRKGKDLKRIFFLCIFVFLVAINSVVFAEPIEAELGKLKVWVGEGVPLYITLKATGPFEGTASFDLPELPGLFFINQGRPVVGSETINGETWMTQRHSFKVFTQQSGLLEIPGIPVRYQAKPDFLSDPEPYTGSTEALQFRSKQPPGVERGTTVLTVDELDISQHWEHLPREEVDAGLVVTRRITRRSKNTTAMLFQPLETIVPDGVRIYLSPPSITDHIERGTLMAERIDSIKYQFVRGGTVDLPEIELIWWDGKKLHRETLPGERVKIKLEEQIQPPNRTVGWSILLPLVGGIVLLVGSVLAAKKHAATHEVILRKRIKRACRSNNPTAVYDALLNMGPDGFCAELKTEWDVLTKYLYSVQSGHWEGEILWVAFKKELVHRKVQHKRTQSGLAPLNPV